MTADPAVVRTTYERLSRDATAGGYNLNPDEDWCLRLVDGILTNEARYGYWCCPCRLASGDQSADRDIVCPCDYRDSDLGEFGACYCALYVSEEIAKGQKEAPAVPERRPPAARRITAAAPKPSAGLRVWRCRVCGYLCARDEPPGVCPICKAKQDRFETFAVSWNAAVDSA